MRTPPNNRARFDPRAVRPGGKRHTREIKIVEPEERKRHEPVHDRQPARPAEPDRHLD